jgi:hypothetical protein
MSTAESKQSQLLYSCSFPFSFIFLPNILCQAYSIFVFYAFKIWVILKVFFKVAGAMKLCYIFLENFSYENQLKNKKESPTDIYITF